jgi:hypothetical protein
MTPTTRQHDQPQHDREPVAELSAEERQLLARIDQQVNRARPNRFRRFLKNPPLLFWWS